VADTEKLVKKCDFCASEYIVLSNRRRALIMVQRGEHHRFDLCGDCGRKVDALVRQLRTPAHRPVTIIANGDY
jgi:hypothetical protein